MRLLTILFLLTTLLGSAQREHLQKADNFYQTKQYHEAIAEYKLALSEDFVVNKFYVSQQIAKTYMHLFDYENAAVAYENLMKMPQENSAENIYEYGQILRNLEKYNEAASIFKQYAEKSGKTDLLPLLEMQCAWPQQYKNDQQNLFELAKTNIETGGRSFGVAFSEGGLIISSPQAQDFDIHTVYYDLATTNTKDSVNFDPPTMISSTINHLYYEGTPSISSDGKTLYYAANASVAKKIKNKKKKEDHLREDGLNVLKIFVAHKVDGKWTSPVELNINSDDYNSAFPHISKDGKQLFFASDRPGTFGLMDIYVSNKINDSTWTEPKNLGADVNSFENDMYPYLMDDELYFSSKGHEGFGGSDIYKVDYVNKVPSNRRNLGASINSSKDDFALILRGNSGYLSSNRDGLHGYDHIYYVKNANDHGLLAMDTLRGEIIDQDTKKSVKDVVVQLYEEQPDGSYKLIESQTTGEDGKWEFIVRPDKNYRVNFIHPDYEDHEVKIPVNDGQSPSNRDKILSQLNPLKLRKKSTEKDRLHGEIINKITNEAIPDVEVELYEKQDNGNFVLVDQMITKEDGKWEFWVDKDKEYQVKFNKKQFDQNVVDIPANDGRTPSNRSKILSALNPFALNPEGKKDNVITINNLYFDFNQVSVQTKSMPILKNLLSYLKDNPETKIELGAHTDAVGPADYNMKLSQKRANFCRNYLVNNGISKSRIRAQGYGESKILNGCENWNDCSEAENEINRRVEVKFL